MRGTWHFFAYPITTPITANIPLKLGNWEKFVFYKRYCFYATNPTRWDRDTASELCKMVRDAHIRLSLLLLRTICANGVMGKKKQNKLAALLVNIPDERFLVVRQPFLDARESADLYNY